MGIYDRDYSREENEGATAGGSRMMVTNVVLVTVGIYVVQMVTLGQGNDFGWVFKTFSLKSDVFLHPLRYFELLSYGFLHAPPRESADFFHIIIDMVVLWMFGRDIESKYGRKEFLGLYLSLIVLAGLGWAIADSIQGTGEALPPSKVVGASGGIAGIIALFALNYPKRTLLVWGVIPMPAWAFAGLLVFFDVMGAINRANDPAFSNVAYTCHLSGAAFGYLYFVTGWSLQRLIPSIRGFPSGRSKPRLRVHDPDTYDAHEERVDEILRKIRQSGQDSLSKEERRILEKASKRYQQKHQ